MSDKKVLALGFFDAIHLGHTALLRSAGELARSLDADAAVVTFDIHPDTLVYGRGVPLLNTPAERAELIGRLSGIREIITLAFTPGLMQLPWERFLASLSSERNAAGFVVGRDFRFGRGGEGDCEKLAAWCSERGLSSRVIDEVTLECEVVSSTLLRSLLSRGEIEEAVSYLGHPYLRMAEAQTGLIPADPRLVTLPDGVYLASITLPDGSRLENARILVRSGALQLPRAVSGSVHIAFFARQRSEATP